MYNVIVLPAMFLRLFTFFLCVTLAGAACTLTGNLYEDNVQPKEEDPHQEPIKPPQMTLTLDKSGIVSLGISGSGSISINWGDGSAIQTTNIYGNNTNFTHSGNGTRTITVAGLNIMRLDCSDNQVSNMNINEISTLTHLYCNDNVLTSLDVSGNSSLVLLLCNNNNLTYLNVNANTSLSVLNCSYNNMQSSALNSLLSFLHVNNISGGKTVILNNNTGVASPQSLTNAISKGWEVID